MDEYSRSLLCKLNSLRKDSVLCDVEITVCGEAFHAHRILLSAASQYFQVMFCGSMVESHQREIVLQGLSPRTFVVILDFIYSGKISVTSKNVQELLAAAKMLQVDDVMRCCCEFLSKELTPSNCLGILLFSDIHACKNLYQTVLNYVQRNFKEVSQNEEFLQLDKSTLLMLVKSDKIKVNEEEDVFVSVISWILDDVSKRCQFIEEIFEHVRLPLLSPECVKHHLNTCLNAGVKKMLHDLYEKSLRHQQLPENTINKCPRTHSQKYFYLVGGYTRKSDANWNETISLAEVERYDESMTNLQTAEVQRCDESMINSQIISPMNHPRNSLGVAALNGLIYAIGGEKDSLIYDSMECYNPILNQWNVMASMDTPRVGLAACVVNDEIYVIGGWVGSEIAKTIVKYNPDEDCWFVVGDVPTPRYHTGVCEMNGLIYSVGGMDDFGEDLESGDCYDPVREKWCSIAPMQHKRSCLSVVSLSGFIYAIGGCNGSEGALHSVEKYDIEKETWEEVQPLPSVRISSCATRSGKYIYVFGGRTLAYPPEILDSIDCYDTSNNKWFSVGKFHVKRSEAGVVIV